MINYPSDVFNATVYAQPGEKSVVRRSQLIMCIKSRYRNQRILGAVLASVLTAIFAGLAFIPKLFFICTGMAVCFFVFGVYLIIDASVKLKKLMNMDFTVTTDVFCSKHETHDREDNRVTGRSLVFQKYGNYKLVSGSYLLNNMDDIKLFNYAQYGQSWYVVVLSGVRSIQLAFPTDLFSLADGEFIYADGVYTPLKNVSAAELENSELNEELEKLGPEKANLIAQAQKTIKSLGNMNRISGGGTALCVLLFLFGLLYNWLAGVNLILLLVIACATNIPALIAARRSAVAVRKVNFDYSGFFKLNEAQSGRAFCAAIFTFFNIIICMANFVIYVKNIYS